MQKMFIFMIKLIIFQNPVFANKYDMKNLSAFM